ncbi:hypothetical protein UFOVP1335_45 [uncultured Caudovirales phage]|uniref:Large polyvalent protein associated domain-containing protein n=3 Tax=uncultured Caudovirales phage TaxID=2100421 RepID=A0A6J5RQM5_9CAUD|nr:hypothetical protein UFOVP914_11 [uncultured Caudovirales phage]CAB4199439.1 hypothetical protein UFOVP1335_45 [uncultured Caudovirales phage]
MAANDNSKLYQQLAALNTRPQNAVVPSRSNALDFRDATIRAMQSAPGLSERLKLISQGAPPKPSGALGTLGSLAVNNPLTKGILGGLTAIDIPRRAVISGIKEFKDAVDNNPNTKASFTDYRSQVADPTFGFGRVMPMGGWGGRVVGLFGDLIFDPINWATLGGAILKKSVVKTGEFAASTAAKELAELSSEELIAGGFNQLANKVVATSAAEAGKTTNLRKFLGVKKIQGRAGNEALASGAAKLGATNSEVAEILARGRNAVPDEIVKLMGLNDYGIYYFGSRIKVPFSGTMGQGLAAGLTKGRLGILSTRPGEYLARMATPNGVAGGMSLRDIRFAGRAGKEFPSGLTPKMGLAILDGEKAMRAAKGIAARDAAKLIGDTLSHPDVKAEADVIYKFLDTDVIPSSITDRQKRAIDIIQNATNQLYRNIESNGIAVDVNFKVAKWRERYFPHKLTAAAQKYLEGTASKRVEDIRQYLKVDHSNIGGSFESRNLEALVKSGKKDVDWFGTILTEQHIAGGIDTLNELARNGGFKGDFFETNINRALTSYLENYTEGLGTIAFYRSLKEAGSDIGGMAVNRGMITREALDGIVSAPEQAHRLLVSTMTAAKENAKKYIDAVIKEAQTDLKTQQKVANVTTDELVNILDTGVRETKIQAGRTADAAVQKTTLDNLAKARETFALQKANVIKNYLALANQFEKASFIAEELGARHTNLAGALDQMDARLRLYADSIVDYGTNYEAKMQMAKDLEILNNTIDINIREVQSTIDNLGQHTHEFVNDAIGGIVDYALGTGPDYSTIVRNLNDISSYGRIIGGVNAAGGKRGIAEGLGATNIRALLNAQKKAVPIGSALDVAQHDAWVEVKDLLNLSEAKRATLQKLTRDDVLEILTRAGSSTDANDVGAVKESIAWIFVRSQLDNPNFAKDLLDNPTKSFETIKRILKSAEIQERYAATFALEVFDPKTEMMVIKNIKDLPPELQKAGRVIELYDAIDNLEKQAAQVNEHLTRVPDTRTNVIAASMDDAFGDVFTSLPPDTPINGKAWPVIIDHLKTIYSEVDHGTPELEQYITRLEAFTKLPNQEMTYDELMGDIRSRFGLGVPTSERGSAQFSMQDLRLSAQERALYPSSDEFESFRPRILRKQKNVLTELETARTELKTVTNKLTTTQKEELAIVLGNAAKDSVEGSISEQSMALARATTDLYLEQESMYVLHAANKELSQVGQSLTPQGHAQLMNLTHRRFAATNEAHLVKLNTAKELLHKVAQNVMNSGKSGVDFKLQLQQELKDLLKNPETKDLIEELFPGIALHMRVKALAPEALLLSGTKSYQNELNILADTELRYFGVSGSQSLGGAGTIDYAAPGFVLDETTVRDLESGRRLQESTMGSQGLQKQSILEKLYNKKHTSATTYIENLKKKLNLSKVLTEEQKKNARYELDIVQGRLNEVHAGVMADAKATKELSARSGGSSRLRTIQQRARGNARGNFDVNSIERIVAKALDSNNTSPRPVKEFFAALFGGDDFRVPTVRGSEARRLEGLSFSVVRPEDSYFGRNIQIATEARDTASKRLYSTNPTEAEAMLHKADYVKFLQDELTKLEEAIKDRPEAFKLLQQANKDLDRAEKAAGGVYNEQTRQWEGGLSYTDRVNYLDNLAVIAGETFPNQRVLNAETGRWEIKRIPGTTKKNASGLLPEIGAPYSQPAQYGPALASKQMSLVQGLPIPEKSFTPKELELLKKHKLATILHDRFISQDEYGFALRAQQEYKFKDQLAEVDLTKVDWTVNGDTTNAMSWDRKLEQTVSKSIAADGELEPFTNSDTVFETTATPFAKNINTLKSPFDKDIGTLIGRMNDTNRPSLIFINQQDGREIYLRVAREQDGTPLGYLEKAIHDPNGGPLSSVGTATQNAPAPPNTEWVAIPKINPSTGEIYPNEFTYTLQTKVGPVVPSDAPWQEQILSRNSVRWEPWDYRSEQIKIIEPREVAQENTNVMRKKELQLNDAGGNGTVFDPEEVWIKHNPAKLASGDSLVASNIVNPPYYTKMSRYISAEMPPEPILDHLGNPMRFSAVEQEALHENFTDPIYNIVRNPNKQVYSREVMRLQDIITTKSAAIVDIQKTIDGSLRGRIGNSSAEQVRQTQKRILSTFKEDIKDAEDSLQKLLHAAEVWDSRTSANQKVASLYNSFDKGTFGKETGINSGTQKPHNAIKNWLQTQVSSNRNVTASVSDAVKKGRQTIGKELWDKSGYSKVVNEANSLAKNVEISISQWADQDAQVVTNLIRAKEKIRNVGELNGLTADMKKASLQNELQQNGVTFGKQEIPINTISNPLEQTPSGSNIPSLSTNTTYAPTTANAPATMAQLRTGVADVSGRVTADLERGPFVQPAAVSREEMLSQSRQQLQDLQLGPEAQQASQMQADLGWAEFVNQNVLQAGKNLSKERAALAKDLEKSGKGLDKAQTNVSNLAQQMGPDPYISSPLARRARDLGIISNPMTAQETVLQNAQKAYDISSFLHTGDDIAGALEKIDSIQKVIALGTKAKGSLKSLKNVADYPAFATEFNIFHEEATKYLKLVSNPQVDEKIREQAIKWVESNTAYFKQVANMSEAERLAKTVAGLKAANYADPKTGEIKEGKLVGDNALLYRQLNGAMLQHFDDGMVRLGKQFPNIQVAEPIAEFVQNVHRLQEPAVAMELNRFLGEYTKFFKAYATLSPGFHVRNSISNGFMLFAAGGNPKYLLEGFQMSRSLNEASKSGKSVEEWILSLPYDRRAEARIGVRASAASGGGNASDNLRQLYMSGRLVNNPLTRTSKSLGQWIEGHSRFMLAYDGARQGMDFNTSAARVQRFLIDYEDVSTLDKSLRQIIPFWMWTSRNLPMQVQNIWLNPRAYNIYGNIKRNFTDQSQEQDVVPVWMKEMGAWKLPFGNNLYASPDLGFNRIQSDVNMLQDPARFLSNVNPLIRLPIELTGERQLFSNKRFSKTPVEVSGGAGAALQPLMEILGYGQTGPTGKKFVDDKAFYALRNILPMLSRSESLNPSIGTNPDSPNPLYGLLGLPMRENSQQMQNNELMRRMFEMQSAVQNNKALGGQP